MLRAPLQSSFTLQPLKVSTHHARPHRVSIWFAHPCSLHAIKSESLCLSFATFAVFVYSATSKSLHYVTQHYAVYIVPERLCSHRMNKSRKVFAYPFALAVSIVTKNLCSLHTLRPLKSPTHRARLSVSICSVYLCGLGVTFAPSHLALTLDERAVSGSM